MTCARISTHAPAGGATDGIADGLGDCIISTHAPAGGATCDHATMIQGGRFLLTPLREGRLSLWKFRKALSLFLLTPLREGRRRPA